MSHTGAGSGLVTRAPGHISHPCWRVICLFVCGMSGMTPATLATFTVSGWNCCPAGVLLMGAHRRCGSRWFGVLCVEVPQFPVRCVWLGSLALYRESHGCGVSRVGPGFAASPIRLPSYGALFVSCAGWLVSRWLMSAGLSHLHVRLILACVACFCCLMRCW